ncbi:HNH endonuclease [Streptomyces erythrochromogenes]|uniref:HNH endonuclease n=1 Tax=Streptomyces erythrochromogenes TaxID=285574 RepID=UPI00225BC8B3|nr:HNH endonuclease [Streptomyces erythrochromogenes]MCX5587594.1 HNH endonuclease [Streptomyces erythrochromogenes]
MAIVDMTGQRYGRLTAIRPTVKGNNGMRWLFNCDCGNQTETPGYNVRVGATVSCGCKKAEARPAEDRFWEKVTGGDVTQCWAWNGANKDGYGNFNLGGGAWTQAHRFAYEHLVGAIPPGLYLDHLCRNHACVNPWHLDPVTPRVNVLRGQSPTIVASLAGRCVHGHLHTEVGLYVSPDGRRFCRGCIAARRARRAAA